jgi:uncharacterized protein (TIGR02145 family)
MKNSNTRKRFYGVVSVGILLILILIHSCKKDSEKPVIETGTVTDIDGNIYKTVKIGKQWWMVENLKVKRYQSGDSILNMTDKKGNIDSSKWKALIMGAYFIYDSRDSISPNYNGKKFGFLYNWYVINNSKRIAPGGWHIPSDDDWKELEKFLGMSKDLTDKVNWRGTNEGNKLKIQDGGWSVSSNIYEVWGSNESGFSALGGGCVMYNGILGNPGPYSTGFWWTSSEQTGEAWYRYLDYQKANIFRFYGPKTYGFSIRCIKDEIIKE